MSKKKKFDLTALVHHGYINEGEKLCFVSDPSKFCTVIKFVNGEYKVQVGKETTTVHAFVVGCLGTEPSDHASKWVRTQNGKTLYELWHADIDEKGAA